jgi:hypothetical protein
MIYLYAHIPACSIRYIEKLVHEAVLRLTILLPFVVTLVGAPNQGAQVSSSYLDAHSWFNDDGHWWRQAHGCRCRGHAWALHGNAARPCNRAQASRACKLVYLLSPFLLPLCVHLSFLRELSQRCAHYFWTKYFILEIRQVAVKFHDMDNLEAVLHVLQLMCEGHNDQMQNYLREQTGNIRQVDLVTQTVELLHILVEEITAANIDVLVQVR